MINRFPARPSAVVPTLFGVAAVALGAGAGLLVMGVASPLRLFVVVMGLAAFAAAVARIEWGLLVFLFITYTRLSDIAIEFHGAPSVAKSFVLLLVLAIIVRWAFYGERPRGWERMAVLAAAYGLVGLASLLYAADPARAVSVSEDYAKDVIIAIVIVILMQRATMMRQVIWSLLAAGIFLGSLSVLQYAAGTFGNNYWGFAQAPFKNIAGDTEGFRASGPIGDPNFYAQIMLPLAPLALDRFWSETRRIMKILAAWAAAASTLAIVLSFSRGGFVALLFMSVVMTVYRRQKPAHWLTALAFGVVLLQFVPPAYFDRLKTLTDAIPGFGNNRVVVVGDAAIQGRTSEGIVAWRMFNDNPLLGVGLGNFQVHYQDYAKRVGLAAHSEPRAAHNLYLEIASETGLLGLLFFGLLLFVMFRDLLRARRLLAQHKLTREVDMVSALAFGMVGYLTAALFVHAAYPRYLWVLIGIAFAVPLAAPNEIKANLQAKKAQGETDGIDQTAVAAGAVGDATA